MYNRHTCPSRRWRDRRSPNDTRRRRPNARRRSAAAVACRHKFRFRFDKTKRVLGRISQRNKNKRANRHRPIEQSYHSTVLNQIDNSPLVRFYLRSAMCVILALARELLARAASHHDRLWQTDTTSNRRDTEKTYKRLKIGYVFEHTSSFVSRGVVVPCERH